MVIGGCPLDPPDPRPEEGVAVVLVTDGGVMLEEMFGFAAALALVMGGVTPAEMSAPAPLVLVLMVGDVIPRDTLVVLAGTVTPVIEISAPGVLSALVPSGLVADPDLRSTILEIKEIELVLKKSTSQPRD